MSASEKANQFGGHTNLAEALAAFQADLPSVGKDKTAQVKSDKGSYSYKYADLADVAKAGHPLLSAHGLSFSSRPTLNADGVFVLAYTLRHVSGESEVGEYPLPTSGTPQTIGAAQTYARRYVFCAVTGIVADEDNDAHDGAAVQYAQSRQQPKQPQRPSVPDAKVEKARTDLRALVREKGWDGNKVAATYQTQYGEELREATDANRVAAFSKILQNDPTHVLGEPEPAGAS